MIKTSLSEIAKALDVEKPIKNTTFQGISTDTRTIENNNLFVALKGDKFDGHDYVNTAKVSGAAAAIVSIPIQSSLPHLIVKDTYDSLLKISSFWRNQFDIPIIAVTGSNGKTTVKEMISAILLESENKKASAVLSTEGNLNNHIGVPLTLTKLSPKHKYGVVEIGMNHFGEISTLSKIVRPQVAVITNAGIGHTAGVGDINGVAKAKGEIFDGLEQLGIAVLNADDPCFNYWKNKAIGAQIISFGVSKTADVRSDNVSMFLDCSRFDIITPNGNVNVYLPLIGVHNIFNALAATAAAISIGVDLDSVKNGLATITPPKRRLNIKQIKETGGLLIDDCYNSNPLSLKAAIDTLVLFPGIKILVLGDMKELGDIEIQAHHTIGEYAKKLGIDYLFTFGELTKHTVASFGFGAVHFSSKEELLEAIKPMLSNSSVVLVKGSRSMKMEDIVNELSQGML